MKSLSFVFLLFLALGNAKADDPARQQPEIPIFQEGFKNVGTAFWATAGAGLATSKNPEALFFNPAWQTSSRFFPGCRGNASSEKHAPIQQRDHPLQQ